MPEPLHSHFAHTFELAVDARQAAGSGGPQAPTEIQFMPPGRHRIHAQRGGRPVSLEVEVGADSAEVLQQALTAALGKAEAGQGDRPHFDLNHEDREAAGWPLGYRWAGDDPRSGGVRARVEWSQAGLSAITGRTFRRFSPSFFVTGSRVTGAPLNMGGLVNRAAFTTIQPLFARSASDPSHFHSHPHSIPSPMPTLASALHGLGILSRADADDTAAVQEASAVLGRLRKDLDTAIARVAELEKERKAAIRAKAQERVLEAVKAGRITSGTASRRRSRSPSTTTSATRRGRAILSASSRPRRRLSSPRRSPRTRPRSSAPSPAPWPPRMGWGPGAEPATPTIPSPRSTPRLRPWPPPPA